jgi:hypothetical protein
MYSFNLDYKESLAIFSLHLIVIIYKNMRLHTPWRFLAALLNALLGALAAGCKAAAGCFQTSSAPSKQPIEQRQRAPP